VTIGNSSITATYLRGAVSASSFTGSLSFTNLTNTPTLVSGSAQITKTLQEVTDAGSTTTNSITAANFITTSDKRLKSSIEEIKNPFHTIDTIKTYEYIKGGKKEAGFLAQEVQNELPYAVFEGEDGYLTMTDRPLLAYLFAAVKELKAENLMLREELNGMKNN
jgi:hypothetical protein